MGRDRVDKVFVLIGSLVAEKRKALKISQTNLAELCGLQRPSVVLIEKGRQRLPIDGLYRVASALRCEICDLLPPVDEAFDRGNVFSSGTFPYDEISQRRLTDPTERQGIDAVLKKWGAKYESKTGRKSKERID